MHELPVSRRVRLFPSRDPVTGGFPALGGLPEIVKLLNKARVSLDVHRKPFWSTACDTVSNRTHAF